MRFPCCCVVKVGVYFVAYGLSLTAARRSQLFCEWTNSDLLACAVIAIVAYYRF